LILSVPSVQAQSLSYPTYIPLPVSYYNSPSPPSISQIQPRALSSQRNKYIHQVLRTSFSSINISSVLRFNSTSMQQNKAAVSIHHRTRHGHLRNPLPVSPYSSRSLLPAFILHFPNPMLAVLILSFLPTNDNKRKLDNNAACSSCEGPL